MNINDLADNLINKIKKCSNITNNDAVKIEPAVINYVYPNGNADIYFPPKDENTIILTNIQNQSIFTLEEGDSVEVLMPKGKLSNCWIIAKHQKNI